MDGSTPDRAFLGKALREISKTYHSDTINLDEFIAAMKDALDGYLSNMQHLNRNLDNHFAGNDHYMEEWVESFLAWFEVEQDNG